MSDHTITERRWSDPFHGRRATFTCTCGAKASGAITEVIDARARHERTIEATRLAAEIQQPKKKEKQK